MKKVFLLVFTFLFISSSHAQNAEWIKQNYSKKEYRVPMRDGVTLFTSVYTPKDTSKKYPIVLSRTPYTCAPYGEDKFPSRLAPNEKMTLEAYIFVFQDVRGMFMSEGTFVNMRPHIPNKKTVKDVDESSDTYDTIDWLVNNVKHNNGNVGMWGNSYPGFYSAMAMIDSHPALKAVSPQAPIADWFIGDDMHRNGAFCLTMAFNFFQAFDQPRNGLTTEWKSIDPYPPTDMYNFFLKLGPLSNIQKKFFNYKLPFWNDLTKYDTYSEYWKARSILPHLNNVTPAALIVGGWYDSEDLYGPLKIYQFAQEKNPVNNIHLVMGPWSHGGWFRSSGTEFGDFAFNDSTSKYFSENVFNPFFKYYLKGEGEIKLAEALTYRTGINKWQSNSQWPPKNLEKLTFYFGANNSLNTSINKNKNYYAEFISDPNKPVPYSSKFFDSGEYYLTNYMNEDQRFASTRTDVLVFESEILKEDLTVCGPILANLFVSTTGTDADWVVKVIDVYPNEKKNSESNSEQIVYGGYQRLVRWDVMRGKFRNSFEKPEPFIPNKIAEVKVRLNDIDHVFKKGHKVMVQVQSSFFPFIDRNPQKFLNIFEAKEEDFQKALHKVYFSKEHQSNIILNVVK